MACVRHGVHPCIADTPLLPVLLLRPRLIVQVLVYLKDDGISGIRQDSRKRRTPRFETMTPVRSLLILGSTGRS